MSAAWRRVMRAGIVTLGIGQAEPVRTLPKHLVREAERITQTTSAPSRRVAHAVWMGPVDADGNPMPEEGQ